MSNVSRIGIASTRSAMAGVWLLATSPSIFAEAPAPDAPAQPEQPQQQVLDELDEITVRGARLHDRIMMLEDRFYRLYNTLNQDAEFDISCSHWNSKFESTLFSQRTCLVRFYVDAMLLEQDRQVACSWPPCPMPAPANLVAMDSAERFRIHMLRIINSDPRLQAMNRERDALQAEAAAVTASYAEAQQQLREVRRQRRLEHCGKPAAARMAAAPCPRS